MQKSYVPEKSELNHEWHIVDAEGLILGKLAAQVAMVLMGKHKPTYTPFIDTGDHVIVINADKVKLTGKKLTEKIYRSYSGWFGGVKEYTTEEMLLKHPTSIVELAVQRMLPKSVLGKQMFKKLRAYGSKANYEGQKHPHVAQKPSPLQLSARCR